MPPIPVKTKDEARDEIEEVEQLMAKLKNVSSRTERRRLMAQFNRKQALQWGSKATFSTNAYSGGVVAYNSNCMSALELIQEQDEKLIWNPAVKGYVDKINYLKALKTQDPTGKNYKGVSPNFGGGNV